MKKILCFVVAGVMLLGCLMITGCAGEKNNIDPLKLYKNDYIGMEASDLEKQGWIWDEKTNLYLKTVGQTASGFQPTEARGWLDDEERCFAIGYNMKVEGSKIEECHREVINDMLDKLIKRCGDPDRIVDDQGSKLLTISEFKAVDWNKRFNLNGRNIITTIWDDDQDSIMYIVMQENGEFSVVTWYFK